MIEYINDTRINQRQDDTDLLWELQHLNKLIIENGPLHLYITFRDEDLLLVCEKGSYGSVPLSCWLWSRKQ